MTDIPKTAEDWADRVSESGISGSVTLVSDSCGDREIKRIEIGSDVVSEFRTKIPSDLFGHIKELLAERDRMVDAVLSTSIEVPPSLKDSHLAGLKASCLTIAIDVIRKKYSTGEDHGTTESNGTGGRISTGGEAEAG